MMHIVTGEYPPMPGGVSDYTKIVATHLAAAGETVHVWTGGLAGDETAGRLSVHRVAGCFSWRGLWRLNRAMNALAEPRRILIQWTPHSFGLRSLNVLFALWVWKRARLCGDPVQLMVHEPFLAFGEGNWRQNAAAAVHRVMISVLLHAANKVWISIPAWESRLLPWCFGRQVPFQWLPVPANFNATPSVAKQKAKARCVGHFGTFRDDIANLLMPALAEILERSNSQVVLAGYGSEGFAERLVRQYPQFVERIFATGSLSPESLVNWLRRCDVLLQPYPDGISTRRGTAMAALAAGVPMVSNQGHLSEDFWNGSGAVALADCSSPTDLAACTLELLRNQPRREALSLRARSFYQRRFSIRHTVAALLGSEAASTAAA